MKVTTKQIKENKAVLLIEETKPYFVNALRRIMLAELPKLAIDDVIIYDNTSALFDEIISHRLSLIPIPTDLKSLNFRDQCTCKGKGCPSCTVRYTLSKEVEGTVYSKDLQPEEKSFAIKEEQIPIVELSKDQRVILEVEAVLGRGRDHAKWQAVIAPGFKYYPKITIDQKLCDQCQECVDICPKNILAIKDKKLIVTDLDQCTLCKSCMERCETKAISVEDDNTKFLFHFETDGALTPQDAIDESIAILEEKYDSLNKQISKLK